MTLRRILCFFSGGGLTGGGDGTGDAVARKMSDPDLTLPRGSTHMVIPIQEVRR